MKTPLLLAALCCAPAGHAAAKELTANEFMENLSELLEQAPEPPPISEARLVELEDGDPSTYMFIRGAKAHPPEPVNLGGNGTLTLTRPDRMERATAAYRRADGSYDGEEIKKIQRLMRSGGGGMETEVSVLLLEILDAVEDGFGGNGLTLLSGYRTPGHNRRVAGSARRSLHMLGWAADIRVPGRRPAEVARFARRLRAGGVGCYTEAAFVHLDSGRRRYWQVPEPPPARAK